VPDTVNIITTIPLFTTIYTLFMAAVFADFDGLVCFCFEWIQELDSGFSAKRACAAGTGGQVAEGFSTISFCHCHHSHLINSVSLFNDGLV
jgi:uncharacterized membrane protein YhfC